MKANIFITDLDYFGEDRTFMYLFGFQPSLGGIVLVKNSLFLFLDGRYWDKIKKIDKNKLRKIIGNEKLDIIFVRIENLLKDIIKILKKQNVSELILQGNIAVFYYKQLIKEFKNIEINEKGLFFEKRKYKTKQEKINIIKAIKIIDKVYKYIQKLNKKGLLIGKTELEIRGIIVSKIFEFGGEKESFDTIVAFGKNSAVPHHTTGKTKIKSGVLLIDMGAKYKGYCSDFTRTFWVGEKNKKYKKFKEIYNIVKQSHENTFIKTKVGMTGKQIDSFSRKIIEEKGYGKYFIHSTGHSLGLDIHEAPYISSNSDEKIKNNMVFTIEPGIYLSGEFGVRLEDIVFMEDGELKKYTNIKI